MRAAATERCGIFLVSTETGETRRLTFPPADSRGDTAVALSPDGRRLVFARVFTEGLSELYLLPLGDDLAPMGAPKQLTSLHRWIVSPTWLPDSSEIVFASGESSWMAGGAPELWRMAVSGPGEPHHLVFAGEMGSFPDISRRGNRLAYMRGSVNANIWRLDLGGRTRKTRRPEKVIFSTRIEKDPQYSPDGRRIAFASARSGTFEIWVARNDGSDPIQLTSLGATRTEMPRWSPDGKNIVFDSNRGGRLGLYLISAHGGPPRRLNESAADQVAPSWSRDGRYIYFGSSQAGDWQIWKMPLDGGRAVQVTRKGGYGGFESGNGRYFYYAKGPWETSLWRVPAGGGEEVQVLESVTGLAFAVVDDGIYFERPLQDDTGHYLLDSSLEFLDFRTGESQAIAKMKTFWPVPAGMAVSPDQRQCVYTQLDDYNGDLMLIDNFR
jgi:Tol biopolymer transport system component